VPSSERAFKQRGGAGQQLNTMDVRSAEPAVAAPIDQEDIRDEFGDPTGGEGVIFEVSPWAQFAYHAHFELRRGLPPMGTHVEGGNGAKVSAEPCLGELPGRLRPRGEDDAFELLIEPAESLDGAGLGVTAVVSPGFGEPERALLPWRVSAFAAAVPGVDAERGPAKHAIKVECEDGPWGHRWRW